MPSPIVTQNRQGWGKVVANEIHRADCWLPTKSSMKNDVRLAFAQSGRLFLVRKVSTEVVLVHLPRHSSQVPRPHCDLLRRTSLRYGSAGASTAARDPFLSKQ